MDILIMIVFGFLLDLLIGDPPTWPHPVRLIGRFISLLVAKIERKKRSVKQQVYLGTMLGLSTVLTVSLVTALIMYLAHFNKVAYLIIGTYFSYTTISIKGLSTEAHKIMKSLQASDLKTARKQLSMIVGRDTSRLDEDGISKATIETIAENINDGVIAPLFYLIIGGPILGLAYKAVNTLDSMVGYRNERFINIGRFSAKMDDVCGFIPARLTWIFMIVATFLLRLDYRQAFKIGIRDHLKHNSPNSAYPESVIAGALDLQLGGPHYYFGKIVEKPFIGQATKKQASNRNIRQTIAVLYTTAFIGLAIFSLARIAMLLIGNF